jgi:hypothetical protein
VWTLLAADSRGTNLARTNAKALFLNLQMSVIQRASKYKALYLRDREGEMRLLESSRPVEEGEHSAW